jgi:hypothetical protein
MEGSDAHEGRFDCTARRRPIAEECAQVEGRIDAVANNDCTAIRLRATI